MRSVNQATARACCTPELQSLENRTSLLEALILGISQVKDLNAALTSIIQTVCQHQGWLCGESWQFDPEAKILKKQATWSNTLQVEASQSGADPVGFSQRSNPFIFAPDVGIPGRVCLSQQSEWHADVSKVSKAVFPRCQAAAECGIKAALGIPLVVDHCVLAVLVFFSDQAIPEDLSLIKNIDTISVPIAMLVQQRQAEEALRESEARFYAFMSHNPAMAFMKDEQGRFVYINQSLEKAFNVTQAELIGQTDASFLSEDVARQVGENDQSVLASNQAQTIVEVVPTPDGTLRYWQSLKFPFTDHAGRRFVGGIAFDITQQKQFEQQLAEEKELAQVTLRSIGDAVITTDAAGRVQSLNPVAEALTGWTQVEAEAKPLTEIFNIIHETTRQPAVNPVMEALLKRQIVEMASHTALIARDGTERAVEDSAAPIQTHDGRLIGAVMVFRDVSHTRHLSKQLSWQASHDELTGPVNRREFESRLLQAVDTAHTHQKGHSLCYLDLDNFKIINDTCGHAAGDRLLQQRSVIMTEQLRIAD
ncbi:MAG: PAS domain-containing protein, partial [Phormidesmis sp.]